MVQNSGLQWSWEKNMMNPLKPQQQTPPQIYQISEAETQASIFWEVFRMFLIYNPG